MQYYILQSKNIGNKTHYIKIHFIYTKKNINQSKTEKKSSLHKIHFFFNKKEDGGIT